MKCIKYVFAVIALSFCMRLTAQTIAPFMAGDKVTFVGNSITDAGFYHSYIWLYYMTRYPERRIQILNKGIGGDDAGLINERLDVDVFAEKPTVIALTFGMNDSGYFEYLDAKRDSLANVKWQKSYVSYKHVEAKLKQHPSVRKILFTTAPYDETTSSAKNNYYPGKTKTIERIIAFQKASAQKNGWDFLDLNNEMTAINLRQQAKDPSFSLSPGDRIHPGVGGHLVMAYFFLKAQGLAGKSIANVSIDAAAKKLLKQENSTVTNLAVRPTFMSFDYLAKALPFPIDTLPRMWNSKSTQAEALTVIPFMEEFNQETLQVQNLQTGMYTLKIDEQKIGEWAGADFAVGINLAAHMNTPQYQQASVIRDLNQERMEIEKRFRQYNWMEFGVLREKGLLRKHNQQALDTVMSLINSGFVRGQFENWNKARSEAVREVWTAQMKLLVDKIYAINKPVTRRITIEKTN
ncbi:MAG TPA: SGNH/GDSL hydrolase family protein [Flavisolibacter sp.]|jgi:lysophospholipase L1-like esterase|nr:SGNH/GDSL hydrolase family protein [Flavisolibacter sp.]